MIDKDTLMNLIDEYAEVRHINGCWVYNSKTASARQAVIEALSGVQALSAAPEAIAKLRHLHKNLMCNGVRGTEDAKRIAQGLLAPAIEALERATPPAEQATPKAAPAVPNGDELRRIARSARTSASDDASPTEYVLAGWKAAMLAASPTTPAEQQAEESHVKLLAECRDAFPIPEPSSPLEVQWAAAMARPEEVPEYVRLCVAAMQAAPKAAPVKACVCGEPQASGTVHRVDGPCYVAAPQPASVSSDTLYLLCRLLSNQHTLTGPEFRAELGKIVGEAYQQEAQEPVGWTTSITWRPNTRLQSEQVIKITREAQPKYGYTTPIYTAPQPAPAPLTGAQIKELIEDGVFLGNCKEIVRAIEHAHGITQKGGSDG